MGQIHKQGLGIEAQDDPFHGGYVYIPGAEIGE